MITITNEQFSRDEKNLTDSNYSQTDHQVLNKPRATTLDSDLINQLVLSPSLAIHHPEAGLNSLVDSAAYLFSLIGKLQLPNAQPSIHLRDDLITEINSFQEAAKSHGYSSEYILASRYALCATLDDIISNTAWGIERQWDKQPLLAAFNQELGNTERFFIILERLIKDPPLYIDVMELMYLCLSLGFKGHYRGMESDNSSLEKITTSLYKHIRAYRGDFSKMLSPYPIKHPVTEPFVKSSFDWLYILMTIALCLAIYAGIK